MIEVEVKVSVENKKQIEEKLMQMGFEKGNLLEESDFYFDSHFTHLKENDMALRIRNSANLTTNLNETFLTYKGPKMDDISMTRKELEMKIENAETGKEILISLGYAPVQPVIKRRQYFCLEEITACMDQVKNLGEFLELEIIIPEKNERETALNRLISLLHELDYKPEDIIRTSYLSMLQRKQK